MYILKILIFQQIFFPIFSDQNTNPSPRTGPQDLLVTHYDCEENEQKTLHKYAINQVSQCETEPQAIETTNVIATLYSKARAVTVAGHKFTGTFFEKKEHCSQVSNGNKSRLDQESFYQSIIELIINGNVTRYTEWSADVKVFPLAYNSQITTTLGMSSYEMVFNQKPRKPIMFTANSHKNAQRYCQPIKDSVCYNLPLHTHDGDDFHHPQNLKLASGTHTEWILNRDKKKHNEIYQRVTKKLLQRQNINEQINSRFTPASDLKIGTFVLIPNFKTQKGISKKLQPLRKGPYQIIAKPTDVTYKITDSDQKEIVQHWNNLLPY